MTRFWSDLYSHGRSSAELPIHLAAELGAGKTAKASLSNWAKIPDNWRCPCCARGKAAIVRLDKNGGLVGPIVEHHDHMEDDVMEIDIPREALDGGKVSEVWGRHDKALAGLSGLIRFPRTWICGDCNNADAAAKAYVDAPKWFSFSPFEIRLFVIPRHRQPNDIRRDDVKNIFEIGIRQAELLKGRRKQIIDAFNASVRAKEDDAGEMVHVGQAAWNVLKQANNARKAQ